MNIFYLDTNPRLAAEYQCDTHVVKMILESAQLLCTAHHECGSGEEWMYKRTHFNHPSAIWCRESVQNYRWLWTHAMYLCAEYTMRYGKVHKSSALISRLRTPPPIDRRKRTPVRQAMPDEYRHDDPVTAYRAYYKSKQHSMLKPMVWTTRPQPEWWNDGT